MSKKKIYIILIIVAIGIALFAFKSGGNKEAALEETASTSSSLSNDFISALLGVEKITLDTSLLNSASFKSLTPSGAFVDTNPTKGKTDPFSDISSPATENQNSGALTSDRVVGSNQNSPSSDVVIKVSRITSTTATISISGIPTGQKVSAILLGSNDSILPLTSISYKTDTMEYSGVATGLISKIKYTVRIQSPESYSGLQAEFETK